VLEVTGEGIGSALRGASPKLCADSHFVLQALVKDPEAYKHAAENLRSKKDFAIQAATTNGLSLQHMSSAFRADADIVTAAVADNPASALFAHSSRRAQLGLKQPFDSTSTMEERLGDVGTVIQFVRQGPQLAAYQEPGFAKSDWCMKMTKMVAFAGGGNIGPGSIGQGNYNAANMFMDQLPTRQRPVFDSVSFMWGGVGTIGMRHRTFGSSDVLLQTPGALLTIPECCMIIRVTCVATGPPEWMTCFYMEPVTKEIYLRPTAGFGSGGGYKPSETASPYPSCPRKRHGRKKEPLATGASKNDMLMDDPLNASTPLGGWPGLLEPRNDIVSVPIACFVEGARVRLTGVGSQSDRLGTLVKQTQDGKWKVRLDNDLGNAVLKRSNLQLVDETEDASDATQLTPQADASTEDADAQYADDAPEPFQEPLKEKSVQKGPPICEYARAANTDKKMELSGASWYAAYLSSSQTKSSRASETVPTMRPTPA